MNKLLFFVGLLLLLSFTEVSSFNGGLRGKLRPGYDLKERINTGKLYVLLCTLFM
ncbi:unnamed protein product [Clavelina lepadiformis]|uniref:Uncharacterized protein n=1 Tax=Clavelina lepadiformis TaxID=159417 RepID=A0ABP0GVV3_CLALP